MYLSCFMICDDTMGEHQQERRRAALARPHHGVPHVCHSTAGYDMQLPLPLSECTQDAGPRWRGEEMLSHCQQSDQIAGTFRPKQK